MSIWSNSRHYMAYHINFNYEDKLSSIIVCITTIFQKKTRFSNVIVNRTSVTHNLIK